MVIYQNSHPLHVNSLVHYQYVYFTGFLGRHCEVSEPQRLIPQLETTSMY
jgi:hypothetical protein